MPKIHDCHNLHPMNHSLGVKKGKSASCFCVSLEQVEHDTFCKVVVIRILTKNVILIPCIIKCYQTFNIII